MHALIASDGSEVSLEAARRGVALLRPTKITLLTIADTSIADDSGAGGFEGNVLSAGESQQVRGVILEEGKDELALTLDAMGVDPSIVEHKLVEGSAGASICLVASQLSPDVVVVGSHGRGFFKRVVLGSVSEYVAHHCTSPVLIVRHADRDDAETTSADPSTAADE
ncbi:universal stress protein [soil metagenome]